MKAKSKKIKAIKFGRKLATAGVLVWVAETIIFSIFFPENKTEPYFDHACQFFFVLGLLISHLAMGEYLEIHHEEQKLMLDEDEISEVQIRIMAKKIVEDVYGKEPN